MRTCAIFRKFKVCEFSPSAESLFKSIQMFSTSTYELTFEYLLCVLPMVKIGHFSGKIDQHLSLYCGSVKPNFKIWPPCESRVSYDFQNLLQFQFNHLGT